VHQLGLKDVELNVDSIAGVSMIKNGKVKCTKGSSLLKQIRQLRELDWIVEISHTYRKANT
jgi:hypothetical protein